MARDHYTRYPRPILWLIPGGELGGEVIEPFYISKFPLSNEQYEAFARVTSRGFERSGVSSGDSDPAIGLSAQDAEAYCAWYAEVARKQMRLPSDAEWRHACYGGDEGGNPWGDDLEAADLYLWDAANAPAGALPALDEKKANGFGLYGMLGGVWEWVAADGGTEAGSLRILRGGSYRTPRQEILGKSLRREPEGAKIDDAGFRIVKSLRSVRN